MDELEDLHADRTNLCFTFMKTQGEVLDPVMLLWFQKVGIFI